ncbi:hypothetical protein [Pseudomonas purpurea]|uniref:hypothetical protein n=1 Tax=Pseudomonas purpurea TaxID=3136737 RepID=UPI003266030B
MEVVAGSVIVIAVLAAYFFYRHKKALALRLTPMEVAQINRVMTFATTSPLLALEVAQRLDGHARQQALQCVAPSLVSAGHRQEGLQALAELNKTNAPEALKDVVQVLLDQGDHITAQTLLDQNAAQWPIDGHITYIQLQIAKGETETARKTLEMVCSLQESSGVDMLSSTDCLRIAPLQRQFGMTNAAALSIAWAWATLQEPDGRRRPDTLKATMREYYEQDGSPRVIELAQQLGEGDKAIAASVLFEVGDLESAFVLFGEAGRHMLYGTYEELLNLALDANQLDKALRLIDFVPEFEKDELLLSLMSWHAQRSETREAETLLNTRIQSPEQRLELQLRLVRLSHECQPQWSATLLAQAPQLLEPLRGGENDAWYRLLILEAQLQAQAYLPELRRDSGLISRNLEEIAQLNQGLNLEETLDRFCAQAALLHRLGQSTAAVQRLDSLVEQLKGSEDPDRDEIELQYDLDRVALVYLDIDHPAQAIALRNELREQEGYDCHELSQGIVLNHIGHQRFAEAISALDISVLLGGKNLLTPLHQALQQLQKQAPGRAREVHEQLLDTLINSPLTPRVSA